MTPVSTSNNSFDCPHCGATVADNARMCRACGADASCGWEEGVYDPEHDDDDFDYDSFVAREFPDSDAVPPSDGKNWTRLVMLLLLISMLFSMLLF